MEFEINIEINQDQNLEFHSEELILKTLFAVKHSK